MRKVIIVSALFLLLFPTSAFAEMHSNDSQEREKPEYEKPEKQNIVAATSEDTTNAPKLIMKPPSEMNDEMESKKQEREQKRQEFKQKLSALKDERKQMLAEKIEANLEQINTKKTEQMLQTVTRLEEILTKIRTKSSELGSKGKDVSSVITALTQANTALVAAKLAITQQQAKSYTPVATDATTLKTNFGSVIKQLQTDLSTTRKSLIDAKQAVMKAAMELAKVRGDANDVKPSTPVVTPTSMPTSVPI